MSIDINDPRVTAYALGELAESEREAFEKRLDSCEETRRAVEEIRAVAGQLREELQQDPQQEATQQQEEDPQQEEPVALSAAQHDALEQRLSKLGDDETDTHFSAASHRGRGLQAQAIAFNRYRLRWRAGEL